MPDENAITNQREQEILREVQRAGGSCRIGFLAQKLNVSDETIRRNIKSLAASGLVKKVHGGVSLTGRAPAVKPPFQHRMGRNTPIKKALAAKVAGMVKNGDSLFLDIGSTTAYVAQALQDHKDLYIITNSITVAHTLMARNNNRVFLAGGELRTVDGAALGQDALAFIQRFNMQFAIMSVGALNTDAGFMLYDIQEADISSAAIKRAQTSIVLADRSKFGARAPITLQHPEDIDMLITDATPDDGLAAMLARYKISLDILP